MTPAANTLDIDLSLFLLADILSNENAMLGCCEDIK